MRLPLSYMAHITQFDRPYGLKEMTMADKEKDDKDDKKAKKGECPKCHCDPCCCEEQAVVLAEASKADLERVIHARRLKILESIDTDRVQDELNKRRAAGK